MDTIMIICDSVAMCVKKAADVYPPCVKDYGTNNNDIIIVAIICGTILLISLFAFWKYYKNKDNERITQKEIAEKNAADKEPKTANTPQKDSNEKAAEAEIKRQNRVSDLMREICEITQEPAPSKDINGKYNDAEANKLWALYEKIDKHIK